MPGKAYRDADSVDVPATWEDEVGAQRKSANGGLLLSHCRVVWLRPEHLGHLRPRPPVKKPVLGQRLAYPSAD